MSVHGGGFPPLRQLLLIILPVPQFPSQNVPCSCCIYICLSLTVRFLKHFPSPLLSLWSVMAQSWGWYFFYSKIFLCSEKTTSVSLACLWLFWVQFIHESLGTCCWLFLFHHDPPHTTQIPLYSAFWSLYVVLSLFLLENTSKISLSQLSVHLTTLQWNIPCKW